MNKFLALWNSLVNKRVGSSLVSASRSVNSIQRLINQATGYDSCEKLKDAVLQRDRDYTALKEHATSTKHNYYKSIDERAKCQRELNALLQRKHLWTEEDVNRFTELYKNEMRLESAEMQGKSETEALEKQLDQLHLDLMNGMRERYQQEQLWSDKIRKISAYGTVGLLCVNIGLFLAVHFWIEPRKKAKFLADLSKVTRAEREEKEQLEEILGLLRALKKS